MKLMRNSIHSTKKDHVFFFGEQKKIFVIVVNGKQSRVLYQEKSIYYVCSSSLSLLSTIKFGMKIGGNLKNSNFVDHRLWIFVKINIFEM